MTTYGKISVTELLLKALTVLLENFNFLTLLYYEPQHILTEDSQTIFKCTDNNVYYTILGPRFVVASAMLIYGTTVRFDHTVYDTSRA